MNFLVDMFEKIDMIVTARYQEMSESKQDPKFCPHLLLILCKTNRNFYRRATLT